MAKMREYSANTSTQHSENVGTPHKLMRGRVCIGCKPSTCKRLLVRIPSPVSCRNLNNTECCAVHADCTLQSLHVDAS